MNLGFEFPSLHKLLDLLVRYMWIWFGLYWICDWVVLNLWLIWMESVNICDYFDFNMCISVKSNLLLIAWNFFIFLIFPGNTQYYKTRTGSIAICVLKITFCNAFGTNVIVYGFKKYFLQRILYNHCSMCFKNHILQCLYQKCCSMLYFMQHLLRKHCIMYFLKKHILQRLLYERCNMYH